MDFVKRFDRKLTQPGLVYRNLDPVTSTLVVMTPGAPLAPVLRAARTVARDGDLHVLWCWTARISDRDRRALRCLRALERIHRRHRHQPSAVSTLMMGHGSFDREVAARAHAVGADVVVTAARSRDPEIDGRIASLITTLATPVLLVAGTTRPTDRTVIAALTLDAEREVSDVHCLSSAARLAQLQGAELLGVHVVENWRDPFTRIAGGRSRLFDNLRGAYLERWRRVSTLASQSGVRFQIVPGHVERAMLEIAQREQAGWLVLGKSGQDKPTLLDSWLPSLRERLRRVADRHLLLAP